ncbi:MAG TPA: TetR/AcrR family transcriptional regulator C-terminal domain-containing protein, partial [Actinotalea sp.]|nr:TetR/AcrR family transcriptional regulator C-terminal domain-containing protein [Actinotalea sp.]
AIGRPAEPPAGDWRVALEAWCRSQLAVAADHHWLGDLGAATAFGPGRVAWLEGGLRALEGTPLTQAERTAVIGRLSLHLLGEMQLAAASRSGSAEHPALADYATLLTLLTDPQTSPAIHAALAEGAFGTQAPGDPPGDRGGEDLVDDHYLAFGLELLLDGVAALVERAGRRS